MTERISNFIDNLQRQNSFEKLLLPLGILFLIIIFVFFIHGFSPSMIVICAAMLAFYLAINIGANDVANNLGPAVGAKALSIGGAILIAAVFEASGAIIAGGDVVNTIKGGIIDAEAVTDTHVFIGIMLATLFGSAVWINIATYTKSPVSATHSVIGGLIGAGVISLGFGAIHWEMIGTIMLSWVVSPILGGIFAALFLWSTDITIFKRESRHEGAKTWVPVYVGVMSGAFMSYLLLKGLKSIIHIDMSLILLAGLCVGAISYGISKYLLKRYESFFKNSKKSINRLFNIPLIFSAALLSFAHGANDVANAIGPFAAIYESVDTGNILGSTGVPLWIMIVGALGLAVGLGTYGANLIKTVGNEITKLTQVRAFCVALSAAITVIFASALGLPVSSTHIAIGGIFGIGLFREWQKRRKGIQKIYLDKSMLKQIILSWIITLPASAFIAAISYTSIIFFVG